MGKKPEAGGRGIFQDSTWPFGEMAAGRPLIAFEEEALFILTVIPLCDKVFSGTLMNIFRERRYLMGELFIQTYSFMDGLHNDSRENLKTLKAIGFDGAELFGGDLQIPAEEMKALTEELGIRVISMHAPTKESMVGLGAYANTIGCRFVGLSMETMLTDEDVHRWAREMNVIGKGLKEQGITMVYHNHTQEFAPCGDKRIIDVLMDETDPELVSFELDAGWCAAAGFDPVEHVGRYSGRIKLVHVKESSEVIGALPPIDINAAEWVDGRPVFTKEIQEMLDKARNINCHACEGLVDWGRLKAAADAHGCCGYIVEREYSAGDRIKELENDARRYREIF